MNINIIINIIKFSPLAKVLYLCYGFKWQKLSSSGVCMCSNSLLLSVARKLYQIYTYTNQYGVSIKFGLVIDKYKK